MDSEDKQAFETFLSELDGMIESTHEFIRDDQLDPFNDPEHRWDDMLALVRVKALYLDVFAPGAPVDIYGNPKED